MSSIPCSLISVCSRQEETGVAIAGHGFYN